MNRKGAFQATGSVGSSLNGGMASYDLGALTPTNPPGPAKRYKMRAKDSLGSIVTWVVKDEPDMTASHWTGGNLPLAEITVAAFWRYR